MTTESAPAPTPTPAPVKPVDPVDPAAKPAEHEAPAVSDPRPPKAQKLSGADTAPAAGNGTNGAAATNGAGNGVHADDGDLTKVTLGSYMAARGAPVMACPAGLRDGGDGGDGGDGHVAALGKEGQEAFHAAVRARGGVCVLLAAGQGSRFKSAVPKVIHPLSGKPLAAHAIDAAAAAGLPVVVVVGHARSRVAAALHVLCQARGAAHAVTFVVQDEQMGTGHAVHTALAAALPADFDGDVLVAYADNPGVDGPLMQAFLAAHAEHKGKDDKYAALVVTGSRNAAGAGAKNYGRIVRRNKKEPQGSECDGPVVDIVEKKTIDQLTAANESKTYPNGDTQSTWTGPELDAIDEFNSGIVVARAQPYQAVLADTTASQTKKDPVKYEYYATDFVKGLLARGLATEGFQVAAADMWKLEGSNTVEELMELKTKMEAAAVAPKN